MNYLSFLLAASLLLLSSAAWAQDEGKDKKEHKDKDRKEYQEKKNKDYKKRGDYAQDGRSKDSKDNRYGERGQQASGRVGDILGRVVFPPKGTVGPRQLAGVPRGHYPPPGECRIWYPNRPAGHQPPPTSCESLRGIRLEPGAFILHGDRAYDTAYDWREEERRHPGSIGRDILDILFPRR